MKSVRYKIYFGALIVLLIVLLFNIYMYKKVSEFHDTADSIISHDLDMVVNNEKLGLNVSKRIAAIRGYLIYEDETFINQYMRLLDENKILLKNLMELHETNNIKELEMEEEQFGLLIRNEIIEKQDGNLEEKRERFYKDIDPISKKLMSQYERIAKESEKQIKQNGKNSMGEGMKLKKIMIFISFATFIFGIVVSYFLSIIFTKPINLLAKKLKEVSEGDLSGEELKVKTQDELGSLAIGFNQMFKNIKSIISKMSDTSKLASSTSTKLSTSIKQFLINQENISNSLMQINAGAEDQASRVGKNLQSLSSINNEIHSIENNSSLLLNESLATQRVCDLGYNSLQQVENQIRNNVRKVDDTVATVNTLNQSSDEIEKISEIITKISEMTNLVAINASIEASRAGANGKGFEVVAAEVRKLAEQSKELSEQILKLIVMIKTDINNVYKSSIENKTEVHSSLEMIGRTSTIFKNIIESTEKEDKYIKEITHSLSSIVKDSEVLVESTNEIMKLSKDVSNETNIVSSSAQEQLAMNEEVLKVADDLSELALNLQETIVTFKLN